MAHKVFDSYSPMYRHKHFLIKPQAITNAASHQAAQREYNDKDNDNDRARDREGDKGGGGEELQRRRRHLTQFTLEMTCKERVWGRGRGSAKFGQPKNARQVQPPHTHTLPWLWLCATLIDVPAKPASPRHATPPASTDCCCLYVYGCDCLASAARLQLT